VEALTVGEVNNDLRGEARIEGNHLKVRVFNGTPYTVTAIVVRARVRGSNHRVVQSDTRHIVGRMKSGEWTEYSTPISFTIQPGQTWDWGIRSAYRLVPQQ
jgi:hypothetical protein